MFTVDMFLQIPCSSGSVFTLFIFIDCSDLLACLAVWWLWYIWHRHAFFWCVSSDYLLAGIFPSSIPAFNMILYWTKFIYNIITFPTRIHFSNDFRSTFVVSSPRNNFHHRPVDRWILYIYILALIWIKKLVSSGSKDSGRETF